MLCAHEHAEMLLVENDGNLGFPAPHSMFSFLLDATTMQAKMGVFFLLDCFKKSDYDKMMCDLF